MFAFVLVFNEKHCSENIVCFVVLCGVMRIFLFVFSFLKQKAEFFEDLELKLTLSF